MPQPNPYAGHLKGASDDAPEAITCAYDFLIPLPRDQAEAALEAVGIVQRHARLEEPPAEHADEWTEDGLSYAWALPTAPPFEENPERSRLALAIANALWNNSEIDGDLTLEKLDFALHFPAQHYPQAHHQGLRVTTRAGAWGSVNAAVGLIRACQAELNAPVVGFSFHTFDGWQGGGAVHVAPGEKTATIDLEDWILKQQSRHLNRKEAARQAAAEEAATP